MDGESERWHLVRVRFDEALDKLPNVPSTPRERLLRALEMYEEGVAMQRLVFRRRHPSYSEEEIEHLLRGWLAREDETS